MSHWHSSGLSEDECWGKKKKKYTALLYSAVSWSSLENVANESFVISILTLCHCDYYSPWPRVCLMYSVMSDSANPWTVVCQAPVHGDITGRNTGVGCHFLLRGSSQSRDRTQVSCIAGRFYTAEPPISCSRVSDNRSCINSFFTGSVVDHLNVKCHLQLPHPVFPPIFYSFPFFLSSSLVSAP